MGKVSARIFLMFRVCSNTSTILKVGSKNLADLAAISDCRKDTDLDAAAAAPSPRAMEAARE
jgi:hypothetical protein